MREQKIQEALDAAREYYEATTAAFYSPKVQHTKKRLGRALADLEKQEPPSISAVVFAPWPVAQPDGDAG